jgi:hypothetical protein
MARMYTTQFKAAIGPAISSSFFTSSKIWIHPKKKTIKGLNLLCKP